jgi:hypothetical protein
LKQGEEQHQDFWAFAHPAHLVQYKDGAIPAQVVLFAGDREKDSVNIQDSVQQSWALPEVEEVVAAAPHSPLLTDLMAAGLPYKERVTLFLHSLEAIVRSLPCLAIHWRPSQQVTLATEFLKARDDAEGHLLLSGPLNVRCLTFPTRRRRARRSPTPWGSRSSVSRTSSATSTSSTSTRW